MLSLPVGLRKWGSLTLGVLLLLIGAVWCLQGIGLLTGSSMTGEQLWFAIGLVVGLIGLALLGVAARYFRGRDTSKEHR